jgi:succinoglycan biosynthesis transport protein ExoP
MGIDIFQLPGILLRRWLYVVVAAVLCMALATGFVVMRKPVFIATTDILIDPQGLSAGPVDPTTASGNNQDGATLESQIYIVQSREVLNPVVDALNLTSDRFLNPAGITDRELATIAVVGGLQKNLLIVREGSSYVLSLTVKHRDMTMAAKIANTVAEVYLKRLHTARQDASTRASGAFELQARDLAEKLRRAEEELEKFKAANNLVATGPQQNLVIDQQVEGVNRQLIAARADLELKRANYDQVKGLTVGSIAAGGIPEALASTALSAMRGRYADLAARADQLSATLGASHPQMLAARSQVAGLRQEMEEELARIRASMKGALERADANAAALQRRLDTLTTSSLDTSEAGIKARALQSEVEALRTLYKTLLTRASELGQRDTVDINNSRIISKAVPGGGSSFMMKIIIIVAGALFGVALGSGLAVLREILARFLAGKPDAATPVAASAIVDQSLEASTAAETTPTVLQSRELPVIAHIPAAQPTARRFSLSGRKFVESGDVERRTQIGVSRTVDTLLRHSPDGGPSTIVFISPDNDNASRFLPDVAGALHRLKKEVLFSGGEGGRDASAAEAPLGDRLKFNRLSPGAPQRARGAAPTFSNFTGQKRKADFIIIDANGEEARHHLAELLERASGILLVARDGDEAHLSELVDSLSPWRDRMLGTIKLGSAA